jgi:hypothetical protein
MMELLHGVWDETGLVWVTSRAEESAPSYVTVYLGLHIELVRREEVLSASFFSFGLCVGNRVGN